MADESTENLDSDVMSCASPRAPPPPPARGRCCVDAADGVAGAGADAAAPPPAAALWGASAAAEELRASFRMGYLLPATGVYELQHGIQMEDLPVWCNAAGFWLYSAKGRWAVNKTSPDTPHVPVRGLLPLFASAPHDGKLPSAPSVGGWQHISGGTPAVSIKALPRDRAAAPRGDDAGPAPASPHADDADAAVTGAAWAPRGSDDGDAPPTPAPGGGGGGGDRRRGYAPGAYRAGAAASASARQPAAHEGGKDGAGGGGMSATAIAALPMQKQKDALGEELFRRVGALTQGEAQPGALAAKITGMLLEVGVEEALNLLSSPQLLGSKVQEALAVLKVYEKAFEVEEVRRSGQQVIEQAEADAARLRRDLVRAERSLQDIARRHHGVQLELARRCDFPMRFDTLSWQELRLLDQRVAEYGQAVRRERQDRRLCKVCMDAESCVVLLPCKHQVLCGDCGARVDRCPICTQLIVDRFEPFCD